MRKKQRVMRILPFLLVLACSFLLLTYFGYADGYQTYTQYRLKTVAAEGETLQHNINTYLQGGLPLDHYIGYTTTVHPLVVSDSSLQQIEVLGERGQVIFSNQAASKKSLTMFRPSIYQPSLMQKQGDPFVVEENWLNYRVLLPLHDKFGQVGQLELVTSKSDLQAKVLSFFPPIAIVFALLLVLFLLFFIFWVPPSSGSIKFWLPISYSIAFFIMTAVITFSLVQVYTTGIIGKTNALAASLSQRLSVAEQLGIHLDDLSEIDQVLQNYKDMNQENSYVALVTADHHVLYDTDARKIESLLQQSDDHYDVSSKVNPNSKASEEIHIGVPKSYVYQKIWENAKNSLVLFVASGLLSMLSMNLLLSHQHYRDEVRNRNFKEMTNRNYRINMVRFVYFLSVFAESLSSAFLPQYVQNIAIVNHHSAESASIFFMIYFITFTLALIPAGRFAEKHSIKGLILFGFALLAGSLFLLSIVKSFWLLLLIRALFGAGQGMLLVGLQTYLLTITPEKQKTQGASVIVFGYNGGMVSGTAIGALLVKYISITGVFVIGGVVSFLVFVLIWRLLPSTNTKAKAHQTEASSTKQSARHKLIEQLHFIAKDWPFLLTCLLIGITTKAVLTGVMIYAMPLLMAHLHFPQDEIGQMMMLYSGGVIFASLYVSKWVDRMGRTHLILFWGSLVGGVGLLLMGLVGYGVAVLILGVILLGLAHGCINAPIITHVTKSNVGQRIGQGSITSIYRFIERIGHISGPSIFGFLLVMNQDSALSISWSGLVIILFGLVFLVSTRMEKQVPEGGQV